MVNQCATVNILAPANIISANIQLNPTTCVEPCDVSVTVTWQNTGDITGQFTPGIIVDSSPAITLPLESLDGNNSVTHSFTVPSLIAGIHTIQASPNAGTLPATINIIARGNVSFSSNPSGAKIFIDDLDTGLTTPNTVTYLTPGSHTYKLSVTGYRDETGTVNILSGQTITMPTFNLILATGDVYITSTPTGADIFIDGLPQGTTPNPIANLSVGTHTYKLSLEGYVDSIDTFDIFQDQLTRLSVTMVILPGSLIVESTPPGAEIWVAPTGQTPTNTETVTPNNATPISLAPGSYDVKLTLENYNDYIITSVQILTKQITTLTINLTPIPGSLTIESTPTGAEIWLAPKGQPLVDQNATTPSPFGIIPGDYDIKLALANYYDYTDTITIGPNQSITITEELSPLPGHITVASNPSGAKIFLDGTDTGLITPNTVTADVGTHTIVISLTHYYDSPETVVIIGPNETVTIPEITLTPIPGELVIDSIPSGAKISIDGTDTGLMTPNTVSDILVGSHTVLLSLDNYFDFTTTISIGPEETVEQTYTLTPRPGTLTILSYPSEAEIWLASSGETPVDKGIVTPNPVTDLPPGIYDVKLTLTHYNDLTITGIVINPNQGTTITEDVATLIPLPGSLDITSTPLGAEIFINDVDKGKTTHDIITGLVPGTYNIKLTLANYFDYTTTETIGPEQGKYIDATLTPKPGSLSISSTPTGASIYLDGSATIVGNTPTTITNLEPTTHTIKLTHLEYRDYTTDVNIGPNQAVTLNAAMVLLPGGLIASSTPPGASIYIDMGTGYVLQTGVTPSTFALDEGSYKVKLSLTGYYDAEQTVNILHMQTTVISPVLAEATGDIAISSTPPGTKIFIDGLDTNLTTPATVTRLLAGTHSYRLSITGYEDSTGTFDITVGKMTTLSVTLTRQVMQAGFGIPEMIIVGGLAVGMLVMAGKGESKVYRGD